VLVLLIGNSALYVCTVYTYSIYWSPYTILQHTVLDTVVHRLAMYWMPKYKSIAIVSERERPAPAARSYPFCCSTIITREQIMLALLRAFS